MTSPWFQRLFKITYNIPTIGKKALRQGSRQFLLCRYRHLQLPLLWLRTAAAQRARKSQVAVAIALQSVNTKEASNANCLNERCKILRSLNRVFVYEIVLCIGAPSKDPARFVDLGFWILRNREAQEYKSSSQETNHN